MDLPGREVAAARDYSAATGIDAAVIGAAGDMRFTTSLFPSGCSLCEHLAARGEDTGACRSARLYGAYQAERFGGQYIYFCARGLAHWASPLYEGGEFAGAIVAGPALLTDPGEFWELEFGAGLPPDAAGGEAARRAMESIPQVPPAKANSLAQLLRFMCGFLSGGERADTFGDIHAQQSAISGTIHERGQSGAMDRYYPVEKEQELLRCAAAGDKANSQRLLNEIMGHMYYRFGADFSLIRARVLELVVLLSRAALAGGADPELIFGMNYRFQDEIRRFHTVEEITYWLSRIMNRFTDCVFNLNDVKHIDVMYKATAFIRRHYAEKITLEDIASHVYLSPAYFSKLFREEMGCSVSGYLSRVRVDAAKRLLQGGGAKLVDIPALCGFEEQSYFSKVFKRYVGMTPGKFRESGGRAST